MIVWKRTPEGYLSENGRWQIVVRRHLDFGRMNRVVLNDKHKPVGGGGIFSTVRDAKKKAEDIIDEGVVEAFDRWRKNHD